MKPWHRPYGEEAWAYSDLDMSADRHIPDVVHGLPEQGGRDSIGGIALIDIMLQHQALVELWLVIRLVLVSCTQDRDVFQEIVAQKIPIKKVLAK